MPALPLVAILNCMHRRLILISPCHSLIHQQTWIYPSRQRMHILYHPVASLITSFWIFMLGHIEILMKTMTGILKTLLRRMQLMPTQSIPELVTSGMKRTSMWKAKWIRARASSRFGIFWLKSSSWRQRNLVSLRILYWILGDSPAFLCSGQSSISDHDLDILRPFAMMIRNNLTASAFNEMCYTFSKTGMENLARMWSHVWSLSRFGPIVFACCINSCICYTGKYTDLDKCPKCKMSCLNKSSQARHTFLYMPLIPHLCALMSNHTYATCLQYCADEHAKTSTHMPRTTTDIFDGLHYHLLLGERVVAGDQTLAHNYFSDHCDIALSFATNSFAPFKKRKHTAWILLLFNYNLPPDQHFQKDNILCAGIIPGPKSHGTQTPSSICSHKNCLSSRTVCLHMTPSQEASSPSMPMSLLALVTFLLFPCSCTWRDTTARVPVECVRSKVLASQTHETERSTCHCPAAIIPSQQMSSSIIRRGYRCARMIPL